MTDKPSASERRDELAEAAWLSPDVETLEPTGCANFKVIFSAGYDAAAAQLQMERNMRLDLERSYNEVTARINGENEALTAEIEAARHRQIDVCEVRDKLLAEVAELRGYIQRHETTSCDQFMKQERDELRAEVESLKQSLVLMDRRRDQASQFMDIAYRDRDAWREQCEKLAGALSLVSVECHPAMVLDWRDEYDLNRKAAGQALAAFEEFRKGREK